MTHADDVLPAAPPEAPRRRGRRVLAVGAAGLAALGVAGGAYAFSALSGGGAQPESVLPAGALAYAEVDLDPAAGQKLAVFRLAQRFPRADVDSEDEVQDDLLSALLEDALPEGATYEDDVAPWIGDRAGVAVLPQLDADGEPQVAVALQHTDREAAEKAFSELGTDDDLGHAFAEGGYVVLAETDEVARRVVADGARTPLEEDEQYVAAIDALGGDQIAVGYVDLDGVYDAVPAEQKQALTESPLFAGDGRPSGTVVVGASAGADHVEVVGRTLDVETGLSQEAPAGAKAGSALVRAMPADAVAALSVTGLGDALAAVYEQVSGALAEETEGLGSDLSAFEQSLEEAGLELPADLRAVLGTETAVALVGDTPDLLARARGGDPQRALEVVRKVDEAGQSAGLVEAEGKDLLVASTPELLARAGEGGLGDSPVFRDALPEVEDAGVVLFVDAQRALAALEAQGALDDMTPEDRADLEKLGALGMTAQGGADGRFVLRLTLR